jgi:hypothetical protein
VRQVGYLQDLFLASCPLCQLLNLFSQRFLTSSGNMTEVNGTKIGLDKFPFRRMIVFVFL